jgi:hypothetical protein
MRNQDDANLLLFNLYFQDAARAISEMNGKTINILPQLPVISQSDWLMCHGKKEFRQRC